MVLSKTKLSEEMSGAGMPIIKFSTQFSCLLPEAVCGARLGVTEFPKVEQTSYFVLQNDK